MLKVTNAKILPAQHRAGKVVVVQQQKRRVAEPPQHKDAGKTAVEERSKRKLITRLLILGFLALPTLAFAECPQSFGAPGVGWTYQLAEDLTTQIGEALTPIWLARLGFISLIAVLGMVVNRGTTG